MHNYSNRVVLWCGSVHSESGCTYCFQSYVYFALLIARLLARPTTAACLIASPVSRSVAQSLDRSLGHSAVPSLALVSLGGALFSLGGALKGALEILRTFGVKIFCLTKCPLFELPLDALSVSNELIGFFISAYSFCSCPKHWLCGFAGFV